jgi:hexosaminidase
MAALLFASFNWAASSRDNFNNVELWSSLPPPQPFDASVAPSSLVWPPPRHLQVSGTPAPLAASFTITAAPRSGLLSTVQSGVLSAAVEKYSALVQRKVVSSKVSPPTASPVTAVHTLTIDVDASESVSDVIGSATKYGYTLTYAGDGVVHATAEGIYGAQYAMESFVQLVSSADATLAGDAITLRDAPMYAWRGLMLDAGRRFFPMPVVENLLDTMAAAKLNVLHLHASDMCRFGVESKIYPNLTAALTGIHAGFYTQADIAAMQVYAKKLGIRVVPEFDFPGHSRGYIPVSYGADGAEFCEPTASTRSQLYGDPAGKTYKVVHDLMKEMSSLFEDEVFNIGCDETASKGPCTQQSTFGVERKLFTAIASEFGKTPEGWEEAYFDAQAATSDTIINTWSRHTASEVTTLGRKVVESHSGAFYFTGAAPGGPAGWSKCWYVRLLC